MLWTIKQERKQFKSSCVCACLCVWKTCVQNHERTRDRKKKSIKCWEIAFVNLNIIKLKRVESLIPNEITTNGWWLSILHWKRSISGSNVLCDTNFGLIIIQRFNPCITIYVRVWTFINGWLLITHDLLPKVAFSLYCKARARCAHKACCHHIIILNN